MTTADWGTILLSLLSAILAAYNIVLQRRLADYEHTASHRLQAALAIEGKRTACPTCPLYCHPGQCRTTANHAPVPLTSLQLCPFDRWE